MALPGGAHGDRGCDDVFHLAGNDPSPGGEALCRRCISACGGALCDGGSSRRAATRVLLVIDHGRLRYAHRPGDEETPLVRARQR